MLGGRHEPRVLGTGSQLERLLERGASAGGVTGRETGSSLNGKCGAEKERYAPFGARAFDQRIGESERRGSIAASQREVRELDERHGNPDGAAGCARVREQGLEALAGGVVLAGQQFELGEIGIGDAVGDRLAGAAAVVERCLQLRAGGVELSAVQRAVPQPAVVPGQEEPVVEARRHRTEVFERVAQALVVVLDEPGDGDHLQTVGDRPVVTARATELDTRREGVARAGRIEPELRVPAGVERSRSGPVVADFLGHRKRFGRSLHRGLEVVAVDRDVGGTPERPGPRDRRTIIGGERAREPPGADREMTAQLPEERERGDQTQEPLVIARRIGPFESTAEVVVIGLEEREPDRSAGPTQFRFGALCKREEMGKMTVADRVGLARFHEPLARVLTNRLEQAEPGVGVFVFVELDERLVDQSREDRAPRSGR